MTRKQNRNKDAPSQPSSIGTELTKEQILANGEAAARLLNEPIFDTAFEMTIQGYQDQWIATAAHESQKREHLYNKVIAASEVAMELAGMVQATQGINLEEHRKDEINPTYQ